MFIEKYKILQESFDACVVQNPKIGTGTFGLLVPLRKHRSHTDVRSSDVRSSNVWVPVYGIVLCTYVHTYMYHN